MSGETEKNVSGWTTDTLKEYLLGEIISNRELALEQLESVGLQFSLIEKQRLEQKLDTEKAVSAALAAAKEAVKEQTAASEKAINKSELSTTEQLKQLNVTLTTAIAGVVASINDVKERVGKIESIKEGSHSQRVNMQAAVALLIALLGLVVATISLLLR